MVSKLKALILKQKRGNSLDTPHNQLSMALYTLNFLNRNHFALTAAERHFSTTTDSTIKPQVLYKDPEGDPTWRGPVDLLGWGHNACVLSPTRPRWIPARKVKPYRELEGATLQPDATDPSTNEAAIGMQTTFP